MTDHANSRVIMSKHHNATIGAIWLAAIFLLLIASPISAQQTKKIPRIGFLSPFAAGNFPARMDGFRQGLRDVGYVEGKNLVIEYRYADGKLDALPKLAAELVSLKIDLLVTHSDPGIRAARQASPTLPILVSATGDLVGAGHADSLARPGGRITGFVDTSPDLSGKRVEILKEVVPKASHLGVIWNGANKAKLFDYKETETAARTFGLKLHALDVQGPETVEAKLRAAGKLSADALVVLHDPLVNFNAKKIVEFARARRLPAMYGSTESVDDGGLMAYAVNFPELYRRSATYVEKILKGANPGELPVQQPTKFEFVVDLNAAKQIGLTIPPNVLVRADRVIR